MRTFTADRLSTGIRGAYDREVITLAGRYDADDRLDFSLVQWDEQSTATVDNGSVWGTGSSGRWHRMMTTNHIGVLTSSLSFPGAFDRQVVRSIGRASAFDGGGGVFEWRLGDETTADGYTVIAADGGRWHMVFEEPSVLDVRRFGASTSASAATNTAAFQAAIDACKVGWGIIVPSGEYPNNTYQLDDKLTITTNGIRLFSRSEYYLSDVNTQLSFTTNSGGIDVRATNVTLRGLGLFAAAGTTQPWLVRWDEDGTSGLYMHRMRLAQHASASVTNGVLIGEDAGALNNLENGLFRECSFATSSANGAHARVGGNLSGQSKRHSFERCYFDAFMQSGATRSMIGINIVSGSAYIIGGNSTNLERVMNLVRPAEACSISNFDAEGTKRLLDYASGDGVPVAHTDFPAVGSFRVPITIEKSRVEPDALAVASANLAANDVIPVWCATGTLRVSQVSFANGVSVIPEFEIRGRLGAMFLSDCQLPTNTPVSNRERIWSFGHQCELSSPYSDDFDSYTQGPAEQDYLGWFDPTDLRPWRPQRMMSVTPYGITSGDSITDPSTAVVSKNLCGSITISDMDTTGTVTFPRAEVNANYRLVSLHVEPGTGTPSAGSYGAVATLVDGSKTVNGFDVSIPVAPGSGKTVIVNWVIMR